MVMKGKRFLSLPVLAVLLSMFFVYYTTIFVFLDDWVGLQSSPGTLNFSIFTVFASLCLFSFFVCVFTDPGRVPSSYVPDVEARTHDFAKDRAEGKKCDKCFAYKPPRTHHCRVCRRCILKMVGFVFDISFRNEQVLFISCVLQKDWEPIKGSSLKLFYVMYGLMVVALTITLSTLSGWHVYLILHNMSTIEYYEGNRAKWLAMKSGQSYRHPFNIGAYKNITLILGPNMLKWLCPTAVSHLKDGVSFPTSRDNS
ncbi:probable protein S-acyltransferase 15 isoform X2 [Gastrolobium bilobum]|uniref:probable protein S-acyltransferase 15 isoform X2 n=1 Tax=Gastrolobium bilobum TaxID=150636 RepID=UPI002AB1AA56|nr:probable protein S-acyltransferase 15 isoform X2 [Gastrolobium bilobum]